MALLLACDTDECDKVDKSDKVEDVVASLCRRGEVQRQGR